ncbi:hypothetical protein ACWT_1416 [Actinoplanes sp. SE50]|uniref:hypothetical protein n=1 Tax=unclassified Actinoplanes TaxID=2626549 RepID=UPI00023EC20A|nr:MULTISPECIES: hypothetical protein [unclassified Actinoplanes]AEV82434.1 hypothetical protein ACPL_1537 [Actinoplanes sp. SE50/110]ATO80831.1 hypothetical protein ACWT_1416 [Actinoplanes sp. SE50]SLL98238.1 hypothetical protein ACSP50_1463 [Actinoplanes sp. SE50/110]
MTDTALRDSPITLDRRLLLGATDYEVTVFPTDDQRLELCIVSSDGDGRVLSELSGSLTPADLPTLTEVLTSTLSGLRAMTTPPPATPPPTPPEPPAQRSRPANHGARWTTADDDRLRARYREGPTQSALAREFGRTPGGIRSRLEHLGELPPGAPWRPPRPTAPTDPLATTGISKPTPPQAQPPPAPHSGEPDPRLPTRPPTAG